MSIGTRIREARKRVKMTQAQLAAKVGMAQGTLSELETGESDGTSLVASFAAALGVNALWLETGKGVPWPLAKRPAMMMDASTSPCSDIIGQSSAVLNAYSRIDLLPRTSDAR